MPKTRFMRKLCTTELAKELKEVKPENAEIEDILSLIEDAV